MLCGILPRPSSSRRHEDMKISRSSGEKLAPAVEDESELLQRLADLRREMKDAKVDWYIVPSEDEHQSEEVATKDKRREWLTGFEGSAGTALVPASSAVQALLFVDSRYWLQAEQQVPKTGWKVVRVGATAGSGSAGVTSGWVDYVVKDIEDGGRVGVDPKLITASVAESLRARLGRSYTKIVPLDANLVDRVRAPPSAPSNPFTHHPVSFSGEKTSSKLSRIRSALSLRNHSTVRSERSASYIYILPTLPDIAWLLNVRCEGDIPFCPVGFAYLVLTSDKCIMFTDKDKLGAEDVETDWKEAGVERRDYGVKEVVKAVKELAGQGVDEKGDEVVYAPSSLSWAVARAVEEFQVETIACPVAIAKAVKNDVEMEGLRQAYLRDARAYVRWISWLEGKLLKEKKEIGEWAAIQTLTRNRRQEEHFAGLAYADISASGPNAGEVFARNLLMQAMAHYEPKRGQDSMIALDAPYLVDSGAQYLDGTIDTTRTHFFGDKPSDEVKRAYTRVLQGHMAVSMAVFPEGMSSDWMNMLARAPLYEDQLDFGHGLGHGVGSYLGVHEYPVSYPHGFSFQPGHVTTVEPGYYKEGEYGIRIESLLLCKRKEGGGDDKSEVKPPKKKWLEWERITQVPIQTSLVDWKLTTKDQIRWLNEHNTSVETALKPLLEGDEDAEARDWLKRNCKPKKIWPWTGA